MNVEHERCRARAWRGGATLAIKELLLPIVDRMFLCLRLVTRLLRDGSIQRSYHMAVLFDSRPQSPLLRLFLSYIGTTVHL